MKHVPWTLGSGTESFVAHARPYTPNTKSQTLTPKPTTSNLNQVTEKGLNFLARAPKDILMKVDDFLYRSGDILQVASHHDLLQITNPEPCTMNPAAASTEEMTPNLISALREIA